MLEKLPADLWRPSKECIEEAVDSLPPAQFALFTTPFDSEEAGDEEAKCDKSKGPPLDLRSSPLFPDAVTAAAAQDEAAAAASALPIPAAPAMLGGGGIGGTGKANDEAP